MGDIVEGEIVTEAQVDAKDSKNDEGHDSDADSECAEFEPQDSREANADDDGRDDLQTEPPMIASTPYTPTQGEIDTHNSMGHAVYRAWCESCITGQGREDPHHKGCGHHGDVPVVAYDYAFFNSKDAEAATKGKEVTKILAGKYSKFSVSFAHVIPGPTIVWDLSWHAR